MPTEPYVEWDTDMSIHQLKEQAKLAESLARHYSEQARLFTDLAEHINSLAWKKAVSVAGDPITGSLADMAKRSDDPPGTLFLVKQDFHPSSESRLYYWSGKRWLPSKMID